MNVVYQELTKVLKTRQSYVQHVINAYTSGSITNKNMLLDCIKDIELLNKENEYEIRRLIDRNCKLEKKIDILEQNGNFP